MSLSYRLVEQTLTRVLEDDSISVVALSGKWGTGKSHLWKAIGKNLKGDRSKPIYVSLFGVKTINELKLRIVQNASLNSDDKYKEYKQNTTSVLKGLAGKFLGVEVENLILLSIPTLVKERLVVLDDVERKHTSLDIDEVMGFINEYSENHKSRFLLLLNQDKLADKAIWETLHEKVIDTEVVLDPTPADAFLIAVQGNRPPYVEAVRVAVETLGINNIRVIRRVCRVVTTLLGNYPDLDSSSVLHVVPSTVLLTVLHYRALPGGPPLSFVTSYNSMTRMFAKHTNKGEMNPEEIKWDALLRQLQISYADEFENIVCDYLSSGVINEEKLQGQIQSYKKSTEANNVQVQVKQFFDDYFWNPFSDANSLIKAASEFSDGKIQFVDAASATGIADALEELGAPASADSLIDAWIKSFDERVDMNTISEDSFERWHQKIHPKILARFKSLKEEKYPSLSLSEAVALLSSNSGYGMRVEAALQRSTVAEYEETIRSFRNGNLADFIEEHFSWAQIGGRMENRPFANAMSNFESACRSIYQSDPTGRLSEILKREFNRYGLADKLNRQSEDIDNQK
ncbi:MAG TPA: P-loop NTPase fold protein [Gallionella sp.]|nr:P-loop NTPase fold protein [Gallionella sp.]